MSTKRDNPLWEGPCAYAVKLANETYEVMVYSTNCIWHVVAGVAKTEVQAQRVTERLNAYPNQTRKALGLI